LRQKWARSRVTCKGRPAGELRRSTRATRPSAMRGVSTQPNNSCNLAASQGPPSSPYTMGRMAPDGTCHSVGACRSSIRWSFPGSRRCRASSNCSGPSAASEFARPCLPCPADLSSACCKAGASQSLMVASRAASETSGHASPSSSRSRLTRARHCFAASSHGRHSSPLFCTWAHRAAAHSSGRGRGRGASSRTRDPSTRCRRALTSPVSETVSLSSLQISALKSAARSSDERAAARRMRPRGAAPSTSAIARKGSRARGSSLAMWAARPLRRR